MLEQKWLENHEIYYIGAAELSKSDGVEIKQSDTFFTTNQGRLKLRHLIGTDAQLVYYDRSDKEGPKLSDYHIVTTDQPEELSKVLSKALGVRGEVTNVQKHVALLKAVLICLFLQICAKRF